MQVAKVEMNFERSFVSNEYLIIFADRNLGTGQRIIVFSRECIRRLRFNSNVHNSPHNRNQIIIIINIQTQIPRNWTWALTSLTSCASLKFAQFCYSKLLHFEANLPHSEIYKIFAFSGQFSLLFNQEVLLFVLTNVTVTVPVPVQVPYFSLNLNPTKKGSNLQHCFKHNTKLEIWRCREYAEKNIPTWKINICS